MLRRFSLYRRGKVYYCQFYNPKTGKYISGRSTGQTNRNAATLVVYEWERNGVPDRGGGGCRPVSETIDMDTVLETIRKLICLPSTQKGSLPRSKLVGS